MESLLKLGDTCFFCSGLDVAIKNIIYEILKMGKDKDFVEMKYLKAPGKRGFFLTYFSVKVAAY